MIFEVLDSRIVFLELNSQDLFIVRTQLQHDLHLYTGRLMALNGKQAHVSINVSKQEKVSIRETLTKK